MGKITQILLHLIISFLIFFAFSIRQGDVKRINLTKVALGMSMLLLVSAYGEALVSRRLVNIPYLLVQVRVAPTRHA